jgi:S-adenosylmethionine/arginine decarboxylase-like enzyme
MTSPDLGRRMHFHAFALRGRLSAAEWRELLDEAARAIDMSPVGEAACWTYPVNGEGGNGQTMVQPITESFLALDTWPDHKGAYFIICSCRAFDPNTLDYLFRRFSLRVGEQAGHRLRIT